MQAATTPTPTPSSLSSLTQTRPRLPLVKSISNLKITKCIRVIKADATPDEVSAVDYSSTSSVFPAEACEIVGGDACDVEMYPEAKLKPQTANTNSLTRAPETVEREYLEYENNKTVFPAEACDGLGGEFCEPEYQKGVY